MTPQELQKILALSEGPKLEFKLQYVLEGQGADRNKAEVVKDLLALVNSTGSEPNQHAFLILGAGDTLSAGKREALSVAGRYSGTQFLNLFNSKCTPPLRELKYEEVECEGIVYGVIAIPASADLHYCTIDLVTPTRTWPKNSVLIRYGEAVGVAAPDEIARLIAYKKTLTNRTVSRSASDPLRKVSATLINTPLDFKRTMGVEGASHEVWFKPTAQVEPEIRQIIKEIFQDLPYIEHDELDMVMIYLESIKEPLERLSDLGLEIFCVIAPSAMKTGDGTPFEFQIAHYFIVPKEAFFILHEVESSVVHRFVDNCRPALSDFMQSIRKQASVQVLNAVGLILHFENAIPFCSVCCKTQSAELDEVRRSIDEALAQNAGNIEPNEEIGP